jgi:hypothetical protein
MSNFPASYNATINSLNNTKVEISALSSTTSLPNLAGLGTITSGTWNATTIGVPYGGTGSTSPSQYYLLLGNGASALTSVNGLGSSGQFLTSAGPGVKPSWTTSAIDLAATYAWTGAHSFSASTTVTGTTTIAASQSKKVSFNGIPYVFPTFQGASSTVLAANGLGQLAWIGTSFLGSVSLLEASTSVTRATNVDTNAHTLYSYSIPANTLGTDGAIYLRLPVTDLDLDHTTSGSAENETLDVSIGGTSVCSYGLTTAASAAAQNLSGMITVAIAAKGATNSQVATCHFDALGAVTTPGAQTGIWGGTQSGTAAKDTTAAQTLLVTFTVGVADGDTVGLTVAYPTLWKLNK